MALSGETDLARRLAPLEMDPEEFRAAGRALVDRAADLLGSLREKTVTSGEPAAALREILGTGHLPSRRLFRRAQSLEGGAISLDVATWNFR